MALLAAQGVDIIRVPAAEHGLDLQAVLAELSRRNVTRLMVEGGARVAAAFARADLIDEIWLYSGTTVIGPDGVPALAGMALNRLTQSPRFRLRATEAFGEDSLTIYERA